MGDHVANRGEGSDDKMQAEMHTEVEVDTKKKTQGQEERAQRLMTCLVATWSTLEASFGSSEGEVSFLP